MQISYVYLQMVVSISYTMFLGSYWVILDGLVKALKMFSYIYGKY